MTAGFRWATPPDTARLPNTPTRTPIAHAHVMHDPSGVLGLRLVEQHAGNHAVTDKHQQRACRPPLRGTSGRPPPMCCGAPDVGASLIHSQGRSYPKVKARSGRYPPDIAVLCSASSNVSADLGKQPTACAEEGFGLTVPRVPTEGAHRVSGPTIRRGGVGSTSSGTFVLDAEFVLRWVVEAAAADRRAARLPHSSSTPRSATPTTG